MRRVGKKGVADRPIKPGTYRYRRMARDGLIYIVAFARRYLFCLETIVRPCGYVVNFGTVSV